MNLDGLWQVDGQRLLSVAAEAAGGVGASGRWCTLDARLAEAYAQS